METNVYHISYHESLRSAVLFFKGCTFKCKGCLRKAIKFDCHLDHEIKLDKLRFLKIDEVVDVLSQVDLKTIVFEGEEPTFDRNLEKLCRAIDDKIGADKILITNCHIMPPQCFEFIEVSIKAVTDEIHRYYTGRSNREVLKNFVECYNRNDNLMVETVYIPNLVDAKEIEKISKFVASVDPEIPLRIDAYWPVVKGLRWRKPEQEEIVKAVEVAKRYLRNVKYLTGDFETLGRVYSLMPIGLTEKDKSSLNEI